MPDQPLQPIWKAQPGRWDVAHAAHLLNRAGFGGTLEEIERVRAAGAEKAIAGLVSYATTPDSLPSMHFGDLSGPAQVGAREKGGAPGVAGMIRAMPQRERRAFFEIAQATRYAKLGEMKLWWLDRMVRTPRPLEEKMTLFWHGLLVSSAQSVRNPYHLYLQNQLFRKHAVGNFKTLIVEASKDPAMLEYLNNNQNRKAHPNENYARELMELFTMGIGHYTEADIKESARAFTGWTYFGDRFVFNRLNHDEGIKTFLGRRGNFDGHDIIDIIFEQPATPTYLARRLIRFFALDEPPADVTAALAEVIRSHGFELAPALSALFASRWFYSPEVMRTQIKSPVQLVVGSLRLLHLNVVDPRVVDNSLRMMGQELFNAPTVKGWDGGRAWINTSTLFARYNLPAYLATGRLPATSRRPADAATRQQFADFATGWSPQLDLAESNVSTTDGVVDFYVRKLIQDRIDPRKRTDLIEFLNGTGDARSRTFDPVAPDAEARLRSLVHLVMSMAEFQIC